MATHPRLLEIFPEAHAHAEAVLGLDRGARMPEILDASCDAAAVLRSLRLVHIGCGSVGAREGVDLARCGPAAQCFVDPGRYKRESLLTHDCGPEALGTPKALVAARRARTLSPATQVFAFEGPVQSLPLPVLAGASVLLLASDNLPAEAHVYRVALELGLTVMQAAVYGGTLTTQVRVIVPGPDGTGACGCCGWDDWEWQQHDHGAVFSCAGGPSDALPEAAPVPTRSPASLCALASNLCQLELIRMVALGDPGESRCLDYSALSRKLAVTPLRPRASCPLDHTRARLETRTGLERRTPRELLREAWGEARELARLSLSVEGYRYAGVSLCACGAHAPLGRFVSSHAGPGPCPTCGRLPELHPLHAYEEVPMIALQDRLDRPLAALGAAAPQSVRIRGDDGAVRFLAPSPFSGRDGRDDQEAA